MVVLDTTFLIDLERGSEGAHEAYKGLIERRKPVRLPAAAWTEYLSGFPPLDRDAARDRLEGGVRFEPFSRRLADAASRLQFELMRAGEPLGWHDLQIAVTALEYEEVLLSSDPQFSKVPGLGVERV